MHQEIGILPHTFTELERSNHFKKIMKSRNVLELIMNLEHLVSAEDDVTKNCKIFIQTILYHGKSKKTYVETRLRLYNKQKTKNSISLPPDPLSCKQTNRRANYPSYIWLHFTNKILQQLPLTSNGWNYNEQLNIIVPV